MNLKQTLGFLYGFYYDIHEGTIQDIVKEIKSHGANYLVSDVYRQTYHPFKVVACSFLNKPCHDDLEYVYTLFGYCLRYVPKGSPSPVSMFSRQAGLTIIISYNGSDWTSGWNHFLAGKYKQTQTLLIYFNLFLHNKIQ